ncbi:MAG: hypothetical protein MJ001_06020 [Paludibacteraceae bacterium]|nr:hypothetical protein [Paludibacteraceae bacterium]
MPTLAEFEGIAERQAMAKVHDLKRVKARTEKTETLYIFFGIHTANVVQLADRIERRAARSTAV